MKRISGLWPQILDRANLRLAATKALRAKRSRFDARRYMNRLDENLSELATGLANQTFPIGRYQQFVVHDPKERVITAPCFEERVLHHAIMNVCEPIFERGLISDTFACRRERGRLAALDRARFFSHRHAWFLKMDLRKYFDSICHSRLLELLERLFKDGELLDLFATIVHAYRPQVGYGLPIGSLTSQHFANFYLSSFDRYVKEHLRVCGYVRYMDDFVLWGNDRRQLQEIGADVVEFVETQLELTCKFGPLANRASLGMDFLGCRVWPTHLTLNRRSRIRFQRKLMELERGYDNQEITIEELHQRGTSLVSFTRTPGLCSWRFRAAVLKKYSVCGR